MTSGALSGIQVLDFTRVLAGPLCTMILGDLGADVVKVENPARGDDTREWGPPWAGEGDAAQSAYFLSVNRNKRSLTLNLKTSAGQAIARDLAAQSHVVIENFKVGQMASFGLGYEDLRPDNPGLVYCSITGFGQTGPYHKRPGYDYVIQAMSGLMSITGPVNGSPYKVGVAIADVITGLYTASAILSALRHSERSGNGQYIDMALLDSQMAALVNIASNYLVAETPPPRLGNQHPNIVPYQTFAAADGEFVLAVGNDRQYGRLCALLDRPDLRDDPRYATNPSRVHNRETLIPILQETFQTRTVDEWMEALLAQGIPAGPINDLPTILNDPQIVARGLVEETTLANGEVLRFIGSPMKLSETPAAVRLPPPALGEHTAEVLREYLNMDDDAIAVHHEMGVV